MLTRDQEKKITRVVKATAFVYVWVVLCILGGAVLIDYGGAKHPDPGGVAIQVIGWSLAALPIVLFLAAMIAADD